MDFVIYTLGEDSRAALSADYRRVDTRVHRREDTYTDGQAGVH